MRSKGRRAEEYAVKLLMEQGCRLLAVNYSSRYGEIDIIVQDGAYICFVEVKARKPHAMVAAAAAVTPAKQRKIIQTALLYLQEHTWDLQPRFDVLTLTWTADGTVTDWEILKGAFDGAAYQGY